MSTTSWPDLSRLTALSRALTYEAPLEEALELAVDSAAELLHSERVVLMLEDTAGELRIRAHRGFPPDAADRFRGPPDERLAVRLMDAFGPGGSAGFLGVPLVLRGKVVGLLAVLRPEAEPPREQDEYLLAALADQLSPALERAGSIQAREDLQQRLDALERLAGGKDDVLRMLDHDLRSPMSALRGYVDMLMDGVYGPLTEAQHRTVSRIQSIARHLAGLLGNVNAMSELASGAVRMELQPTDLTGVLHEAMDVLRFSAEGAGVALHMDLEGTPEVLADGDRLRQVFIQLLENAVKYSPGGGEVKLTATRAGDMVEVHVADHGPGIPEEAAERIFEPYQRLAATAGTVHGAGLGLYLARSLTELMGGTLRLEPSKPPGATFLVRMPVP